MTSSASELQHKLGAHWKVNMELFVHVMMMMMMMIYTHQAVYWVHPFSYMSTQLSSSNYMAETLIMYPHDYL